MVEVVVIGAGIKGAAVAALLSLVPSVKVTLIERGAIGGDTTSHNLGRVHLGTAGWYDEQDADKTNLVQRRKAGSAATLHIANLTETVEPAAYCFWNDNDAQSFENFVNRYGLEAVRTPTPSWVHPWLHTAPSAVFSVREHAFNPAHLTGRLALLAQQHGVRTLTNTPVDLVDLSSSDAGVAVHFGELINANAVINLAGHAGNSIAVSGIEAPLISISEQSWNVLFGLQTNTPLPGIVVVGDSVSRSASLVPHGNVIAVDYKPTPEDIERDNPSAGGPRPLNSNTVAMLDRMKKHFALQHIAPNTIQSFSGIQGRRVGAKPGSIMSVIDHEKRYYQVLGGQASTALIDAVDVVDRLFADGVASSKHSGQELLNELTDQLPSQRHSETAEMVWSKAG